MAMAAARNGEPNIAVEALLKASERNSYDKRGVNTGGPCPYLPGNGGLLYAVAMLAAGWEGGPDREAPGFPADGSWVVKWEGLKKGALSGRNSQDAPRFASGQVGNNLRLRPKGVTPQACLVQCPTADIYLRREKRETWRITREIPISLKERDNGE